MAKKETKKKLKKLKGKADANAAADSSSAGAGAQNGAQQGAQQNDAVAKNIHDLKLDRSKMTADQMTQAQIEEAIKESQDPSSRLKKLRSPLSIRGCLLNILILVVLTVAIILLCCYLLLDKETFNLWVVIKDIFDNFGITAAWDWVVKTFKGIFGMA